MTIARRLPVMILGATAVLSLMGVGLFLAHYPARLGGESLVTAAQFGLALLSLYVGALGFLLSSRRPENPIGWTFLGAGLVIALMLFADHYVLHSFSFSDRPLPGALWVGFTAAALGPAAIWVPIISLLLLFPTGRPPSRRWWVVMWLMGVAVVLLISSALAPQPLLDIEGLHKPVTWDTPVMEVVGTVAWLLVTLSLLLAALSLVARTIRARDEERLQLKWIGLSAGVVVMGAGLSLMFARWEAPAALEAVVPILMASGLLTLPVTATVAILKHRLYDIDVIVNRTLVYASLTAVLVGAYALGVLVFRTVLDPVTGDNDIAIAASTLAVAALFGPARRRIQAFIDRRFYRARYDARRTLAEFGAHLRDEVELEAVSKRMLEAVGATVAPRHASVWLAGAGR